MIGRSTQTENNSGDMERNDSPDLRLNDGERNGYPQASDVLNYEEQSDKENRGLKRSALEPTNEPDCKVPRLDNDKDLSSDISRNHKKIEDPQFYGRSELTPAHDGKPLQPESAESNRVQGRNEHNEEGFENTAPYIRHNERSHSENNRDDVSDHYNDDLRPNNREIEKTFCKRRRLPCDEIIRVEREQLKIPCDVNDERYKRSRLGLQKCNNNQFFRGVSPDRESYNLREKIIQEEMTKYQEPTFDTCYQNRNQDLRMSLNDSNMGKQLYDSHVAPLSPLRDSSQNPHFSGTSGNTVRESNLFRPNNSLLSNNIDRNMKSDDQRNYEYNDNVRDDFSRRNEVLKPQVDDRNMRAQLPRIGYPALPKATSYSSKNKGDNDRGNSSHQRNNSPLYKEADTDRCLGYTNTIGNQHRDSIQSDKGLRRDLSQQMQDQPRYASGRYEYFKIWVEGHDPIERASVERSLQNALFRRRHCDTGFNHSDKVCEISRRLKEDQGQASERFEDLRSFLNNSNGNMSLQRFPVSRELVIKCSRQSSSFTETQDDHFQGSLQTLNSNSNFDIISRIHSERYSFIERDIDKQDQINMMQDRNGNPYDRREDERFVVSQPRIKDVINEHTKNQFIKQHETLINTENKLTSPHRSPEKSHSSKENGHSDEINILSSDDFTLSNVNNNCPQSTEIDHSKRKENSLHVDKVVETIDLTGPNPVRSVLPVVEKPPIIIDLTKENVEQAGNVCQFTKKELNLNLYAPLWNLRKFPSIMQHPLVDSTGTKPVQSSLPVVKKPPIIIDVTKKNLKKAGNVCQVSKKVVNSNLTSTVGNIKNCLGAKKAPMVDSTRPNRRQSVFPVVRNPPIMGDVRTKQSVNKSVKQTDRVETVVKSEFCLNPTVDDVIRCTGPLGNQIVIMYTPSESPWTTLNEAASWLKKTVEMTYEYRRDTNKWIAQVFINNVIVGQHVLSDDKNVAKNLACEAALTNLQKYYYFIMKMDHRPCQVVLADGTFVPREKNFQKEVPVNMNKIRKVINIFDSTPIKEDLEFSSYISPRLQWDIISYANSKKLMVTKLMEPTDCVVLSRNFKLWKLVRKLVEKDVYATKKFQLMPPGVYL